MITKLFNLCRSRNQRRCRFYRQLPELLETRTLLTIAVASSFIDANNDQVFNAGDVALDAGS